jgi:hypothetical protein
MLVAKYVKIFSRTGTQPFLLTLNVGDGLKDCDRKHLLAISSPLVS